MNIKIALSALTLGLCSSVNASIIEYDYEFEGQGFSGSYSDQTFEMIDSGVNVLGSFTVDTVARQTTRFTLTDSHLGYSFVWEGAQPFSEFKHAYNPDNGPTTTYIGGGLGVIEKGNFELTTIFWVSNIPNDADPFENLDQHSWGEEVWNLELDEPDVWYSGAVFVTDKRILSSASQIPEPTTLALLSLGLLGFAAKRRLS